MRDSVCYVYAIANGTTNRLNTSHKQRGDRMANQQIVDHLASRNLLISNIMAMRAQILGTSVENLDCVSLGTMESLTINDLRQIQDVTRAEYNRAIA